MASLKADFDEVMQRVESGRELSHASFEPIFYLVFSPDQIGEVKRLTPSWVAKLKNAGWQVELFSIAEHVADILAAAPTRKVWLAAEKKAPLDWERTNKSLANELLRNNQLQTRLEDLLARIEGQAKTIVLVTDLEGLHPYMRIGAIEAELQGKFHIPSVLLPRTASTR